jgi:hypothetical protein
MNFKKLTSTLLLATTVMTGTFLTTIKFDNSKLNNNSQVAISTSIGGEVAQAWWCPQTKRYEVRKGEAYAIYHENRCGDVYIYMNARAAKDLAYDIKQFRLKVIAAGGIGSTIKVPSFMQKFVQVAMMNPATALTVLNYGISSESAINQLEYASDRSNGIWLKTSGGILYSFPTVSY